MTYAKEEIASCGSKYTDSVIAGLALHPHLFSEFPLHEEDFHWYRIYFMALKSLASEGFKVIQKREFCNRYAQIYALAYDGCECDGGTEAEHKRKIEQMLNGTNENAYQFALANMDVYYNDILKYRALRAAMANGIDVSRYYVPAAPNRSKEEILSSQERANRLQQISPEDLKTALQVPHFFRKARVRTVPEAEV